MKWSDLIGRDGNNRSIVLCLLKNNRHIVLRTIGTLRTIEPVFDKGWGGIVGGFIPNIIIKGHPLRYTP